jgi:hypothetical protein
MLSRDLDTYVRQIVWLGSLGAPCGCRSTSIYLYPSILGSKITIIASTNLGAPQTAPNIPLQAVTNAAARAAREAQDEIAMQDSIRADAAAHEAKAAFDSALCQVI